MRPTARFVVAVRDNRTACAAVTVAVLGAVAGGVVPAALAADVSAPAVQLAAQTWTAGTSTSVKARGSWLYQVPVPSVGDYRAVVVLENDSTKDASFVLRVEGSDVTVAAAVGVTTVERVVRIADGSLTVSLGASASLPTVRGITAQATGLAAPTAPTTVPSPTTTTAPSPTTTSPAPTTTTAPAPSPTAPAVPPAQPGPARDLFLQPFAATSIWNLGIGTGARFEAATDPRTAALLGGDATTWLNQSQYSHPIVLARDSDPVATVTDYNDSRRSASYRIPADAPIAAGSDKHMHVVSPDRSTVDETWAAERVSTSSYRVGRHESVDLAGSGIGPSNGTRAYGGSAIGGLIRAWEVDPTHPAYTGRIDHPIAMALRNDQLLYAGGSPGYDSAGYGTSKGYVWPATEQDWDAPGAYAGAVPMGSYVAIPPSVDLGALGLTPQGLMLARAYQDYGGYVTDRSGAMILGFVEPGAPTSFSSALLGPNWSASDLKKIRGQLRVVTNNSPETPNGAALDGPRRAALKP